MGRYGQFGSKLTNHGPFWSVRAKLANHGPFWSVLGQISQSWAVLAHLCTNWPQMFWYGWPVSYQIELWSIKTLDTKIVQILKYRFKVLFFFICRLFWLFSIFLAKKSQIGFSAKKVLDFIFNLEDFEFGLLKINDRNKILVNFSSIFDLFLSRIILVCFYRAYSWWPVASPRIPDDREYNMSLYRWSIKWTKLIFWTPWQHFFISSYFSL